MMTKMVFTIKLSDRMNGMAIIQSANALIVIFCCSVNALSFKNPSKCFLYSVVPLNQRSNLSDPLTKQADANSKKGVVGTSGRIIPIIPKPIKKNPKHR